MQGTYKEFFFPELKMLLHTLVNSSLLALVRRCQRPITCCPARKAGVAEESKVLVQGLTHEQ